MRKSSRSTARDRRILGEYAIPSRNIRLGTRRTSVRLEAVMWAALKEIAQNEGRTVHDVLLGIDQRRADAPFTSAIRVYIVDYYLARAQAELMEGGKERRPTLRVVAGDDQAGRRTQ
jgi:predicted DNA-binding ribbon-helix-helix protein